MSIIIYRSMLKERIKEIMESKNLKKWQSSNVPKKSTSHKKENFNRTSNLSTGLSLTTTAQLSTQASRRP